MADLDRFACAPWRPHLDASDAIPRYAAPVSTDDRLDELATTITARLDGLDLVAAYVFGSQATGRARADSDIDVAVLSGGDARDRHEIADAVARRLVDLGEVDVVVLEDASLRLAGRILTEGRLVVDRDPPTRVLYEATTRTRYFDFEPFAAAIDRAYLARFARGGC